MIIELLPSKVPPQEPLYHFHPEPEPRIPPDIPKEAEPPEQITVWLVKIESGGVENEFTTIVLLTQGEVLQIL